MSILTRYLLRAHAGPLVFAFTALTGLLFLNVIAQRLDDLIGKGLGWDVILDFVLLSLPHTIALTLPMSVLVAVLYTFSDLTASSEVTAMAAGGVPPTRLLMPVIVSGLVFSLGMLYFNDQVLPEANHRLKDLMVDLGNKSPTFELREQVVNEIRTEDGGERFYLQASRIDHDSNELYDIAIHDVSEGSDHRTTYADSGSMAFNREGTDLYLTLFDGLVLESDDENPGRFQRLRFERQVVPIRGVGDILERRTGGSQRGEREMSIRMLERTVEDRREQRAEIVDEVRATTINSVRQALGMDTLATAGSDSAAAPAAAEPPPSSAEIAHRTVLAEASARAAARSGDEGNVRAEEDLLTRRAVSEIRTKVAQAEALDRSVAALRVEIHKKYAIAFACLVFVLIGAPIAVRFPRGGVGMTIAVSVGVFAIYWVGLIGGEELADQGLLNPVISMWATNVIFFAVGVFMSLRIGRWVATSRGGGWDDLRYSLKRILGGPLRAFRKAS